MMVLIAVNFLEEYSSGQLSRPLHTPTMTPSQPLPRDYTRVQELNSLEFLDIVANQVCGLWQSRCLFLRLVCVEKEREQERERPVHSP